MKCCKRFHVFFRFLKHIFVLLPLECFARNVRLEPDYDFAGGLDGPLTFARWGIVAISIFVWIFPIPIAFRKESYGRSVGRTYWTWWFFLCATALIGLSATSDPWIAFLLMLGVTTIGCFFRTTDEVISDIVESVETDTRFNKAIIESSNVHANKYHVSNDMENSSSHDSAVLDKGVASTHQPAIAKNLTLEPRLYNGGMIYIISGHPHQFNGSDFERVDTEKSVVINGKTLTWNGKNFVHKN
jgi:hypothetical protein